MRKILLKICYDGTDFCGWQVQPNGISVQQRMCEALDDLLSEKVNVTGCSRTDSGVHANEFFCHFETKNEKLSAESFAGALNVRLPESISVIESREVPEGFHARYDVNCKEYVYKMYYSRVRNPFVDKYALRIFTPIDIESVNNYCKLLVGTHDFSAFSASGREYDSTVRTIFDCSIEQRGNEYIFKVSGDGFLYNMVRIMVGTALYISEGKLTAKDVECALESGVRSTLGPTAPPRGLFLNKVVYNDGSF